MVRVRTYIFQKLTGLSERTHYNVNFTVTIEIGESTASMRTGEIETCCG